MTKVSLIINPISGPSRRGSGAERVALATRAFERLGADADIRLTERAGHAHELAAEAAAAGAELVIVWGGDGTMNEVARALVQRAESPPYVGRDFSRAPPLPALGIIPGGSGNGLARELGIPFDPAQAIDHALRAPVRHVDAGELGDRFFVNVAGIGLDAHVAALVSTGIHHRGLLPYLKASAGDLLRYAPIEYTITADGHTSQVSALVVALANSKQWGFGAEVAPNASLDDGFLDLVMVEDRKFFGNMVRLPSLFLGRLHQQKGIKSSRVRELTIRSREAMLFHVDGEAVQGTDTLIARVHPGALRLRA